MKLNNKGFAISTIMYIILIFALILIISILGLLSSRKMTLDKINSATITEVKSHVFRKKYNVGDKVKVAGEYYYVIKNNTDYLVLLKEKPLTVDEVNNYGGVGTDNNHVNKYSSISQGTAYYMKGYGGMAYYMSGECGWINNSRITNGCRTNYESSEIKYVIDAWSNDKFQNNELKEDSGYKARLLYLYELTRLGYEYSSQGYIQTEAVPSWLYAPNGEYWYWTMEAIYHPNIYNPNHPVPNEIYIIGSYGQMTRCNVFYCDDPNIGGTNNGAVRPVINVYKSAIEEE